jgi:hypothetical protein
MAALAAGALTQACSAGVQAPAGAEPATASKVAGGAGWVGPGECDERSPPIRTLGAWDQPDGACPFALDCGADYLAIPARFPTFRRPAEETELLADIAAATANEVPGVVGVLDAARVRAGLLQALGMPFLWHGIGTRAIGVWTAEICEAGPCTERAGGFPFREVVLDDEIVGRFRVLLVHPVGASRGPGLLTVHGHPEDGWTAYRDRFGPDFVRAGYTVLAPTFRASDGGAAESAVTRALLRDGFSLIALRVYEQTRVLQWAAAQPEVDACRLVGLGHSGGAAAGNVALRVHGRLRAWVYDMKSQYLNVQDGVWLDETSIELFRWRDVIGEDRAAATPTLEVKYAYPDGPGAAITFFAETLRSAR